MDVESLYHKERNIFVAWKTMEVGNTDIKNLGDELLAIISQLF
jgi:hypothetical protein